MCLYPKLELVSCKKIDTFLAVQKKCQSGKNISEIKVWDSEKLFLQSPESYKNIGRDYHI